jgi:hypothetical protein
MFSIFNCFKPLTKEQRIAKVEMRVEKSMEELVNGLGILVTKANRIDFDKLQILKVTSMMMHASKMDKQVKKFEKEYKMYESQISETKLKQLDERFRGEAMGHFEEFQKFEKRFKEKFSIDIR